MDATYFAESLSELSETLKPYVDKNITQKLYDLVTKLQVECPSLWIQRFSILDEKAKPHAVAFDFEVDIILYLHPSSDFDSKETLKDINDIIITWDISDIDTIQGGLQFVYEGVTVNFLLARDLTIGILPSSSEFSKSTVIPSRAYYNGTLRRLSVDEDATSADGSEFVFDEAIPEDIPGHDNRNLAVEDMKTEGDTPAVFATDNSKYSTPRNSTSVSISQPRFRKINSSQEFDKLDADEDYFYDVSYDNDEVFKTEHRAKQTFVKLQKARVINHIEQQTANMTDLTDKNHVMECLGRRYSSSLIECYHNFFVEQSDFCISFIRICKFWCLKVFLNRVHYGLLRYVEALAVYICLRKEQLNDFHIIFLDFLLALREYKSIRIDLASVVKGDRRSMREKERFSVPYIIDVSFPYVNILKDIPIGDLQTLSESTDDFLRTMRLARSFNILFAAASYPQWLLDRLETFYFVFQPSRSNSIQITVQGSKRDMLPDDFLPGLSSRLYLWRQCAIADTRKHQAKESGCFYRAVSGLVIIEFMKALDTQETHIQESNLNSFKNKITINFPDYSYHNEVFRSYGKKKSLFKSLLCGGTGCSNDRYSDSDSMTYGDTELIIASPQFRSEAFCESSAEGNFSDF